MFDIILNPLAAIQRIKKERHNAKAWSVLLVVAVISLVGSLIGSMNKGVEFSTALLASLGIAVLVFVAALVMAFVINLALAVLIGKSSYYLALIAVAYAGLIGSVGTFIVSLIDLIPGNDAVIVSVLGLAMGVVMLVTLILSISTELRLLKELYECEFVTVVLALLVAYLALFLAAAFGGAKIFSYVAKDFLTGFQQGYGSMPDTIV